jgi:hypothetical protein
MKNLFCLFLFLLGSFIFAFSSEITSYDITVNVSPPENFLEARARISVAGGEIPAQKIRIFLHEEFTVESILSGSTPLRFSVLTRKEDTMMFCPSGIPIDIDLDEALDADGHLLIDIRYSGPISQIINDVNLISDHLVEMAVYCSWFPLMKESRAFTYALKIDLPADFVCVTDGNLIESEVQEGRQTWLFKRESPGFDIPVVASDQFKIKRMDTPEISASIYYKDMDDGLAGEDLENVIDCVDYTKNILGEPVRQGKLIYVNSPRGGWGYSRVPFFVVSEEYAQSQLRSPDAKVRRFQGQAHEIGHFWWMLTDSTTPDNWIDEALAEFFALQAVEEFFGDGSTREILKKYQSDIMGTTDSKPILETIRSDQAAYVLFYEKGAMIFRMLKDMLGEERLFQILKAFYSSQKGTQDATTEDLLGTFGRETDLNLESFFNQFLNANFLPSLEAVWEGSRHNVVSGNIVLNNAGFETFPLEITFIKLDKRTLAISPGDNRFEFRLPFAPDMMLLDEDNALLKGKYSVTKKK